MRFTPSHRAHLPELDLTAMIDVIFLLIIFFMTTAQFVERARAELDLPREQGESEVRALSPPLIINVLHEGDQRYLVGERMLDERGVKEVIEREIARHRAEGGAIADFEVVVRADQRGPSRYINDLGALLRQRGVGRWRLATEPE